MSEQYRSMWENLGLDLAAHDALLETLGKGYQDIYLTQQDRPEGMGYFDFVMSEVHGLRIKELLDEKAKGRKVIGSFCVFVPEEIVRAADATLVGLCTGADFATGEVEKVLPRNTCSLIKSAFGFKLGKVCPYMESADMIVGENTCDGKKKSYEVLKDLVPNLYVMDLPQMKTGQGKALLKAEYERFKAAVEQLTGIPIDAARLKKGIEIVNNKRKAIYRLNRLRKADPTPISGLDALLANQVFFYDDPVRFTDSVNKICDELENRIGQGEGAFPKGHAPRSPFRLPHGGAQLEAPLDHRDLGGGPLWGRSPASGNEEPGTSRMAAPPRREALMDAIVDRYFQVDCAVFTPNPDRLGHVREMVEAYRADGVIHYSLQFCQPYIMESMPVEAALEKEDIPTLRIETDYSMEDVGQLKTRVEAFVEQLS